ncbi:MFS transporter [Methylovirgula sp. 4M-Z18]|uniref:MFS transporter n=1 Tax=Methylovirgula sp. 4M-Z18 TaxID=2293567 RepID=UPI000E2FD2CC|nr:MFS transporter [Methylovirgula sp. 4M-Z18]RFB80880.1 MFS transporter [Methylovirgula sp. 4M-Z18]
MVPAGRQEERFGIGGILAAVIGNGFEFFDFTVYLAYATAIGAAFYPSERPMLSYLASTAIFGIGFIGRPLGGIFLGAYGDRVGRKKAMTLTIGIMAVASAMIAFVPGYGVIGLLAPALLIVARILQGIAAGGEMGPATMFMLESAPPAKRNYYGSWQFASQNLSSVLVGLIGLALAGIFAEGTINTWAWRIPFAIGILIAPVGMYIRSHLRETLDQEVQKAPPPFDQVMHMLFVENWPRILLGMGLISGLTITQYFILSMPGFAKTVLHLPQSTIMLGSFIHGLAGVGGALIGGLLADRYGLRSVTIISRLLLLIIAVPIMQFVVGMPTPASYVFTVTTIMLFHAIGGGLGILYIPLIFPPIIRATALAFTYAFSVAIFGGTAPYITSWLTAATGDPLASTYYVIAANLVMIASVMLVRKEGFAPKASVALSQG